LAVAKASSATEISDLKYRKKIEGELKILDMIWALGGREEKETKKAPRYWLSI